MLESISDLVRLMKDHGAHLFYAKRMAPNDNSKNQVYLGGDFSALNIIPYDRVYTDDSGKAGSKRDRAKANIKFFWLDEDGAHHAPNAQLILYPKYPEVRMSGFLLGCRKAPSAVMRVRDEGRVLFFGITSDGRVLGYAAGAKDLLASEWNASTEREKTGVFEKISETPGSQNNRSELIEALTRIYQKHWIPSQKLNAEGKPQPYRARNGGGYTLEAELGITPNGYADPDYLGWEIKQYGVNNFDTFRPKSPVTLMTPEPAGGLYKDNGVEAFLRSYGYPDKSGTADRINFGGIYACGKPAHKDTGLRLSLSGFDAKTNKITDMTGGIALLSNEGDLAALWPFTNIMEHWNRKHARAAYVPSLFRTPPPEYNYGAQVLLCEKTDFSLFLRAISCGEVYYDPAIKMENSSAEKPKTKRRSQFRIKHTSLAKMYHSHEIVLLDS